MKQAKNYTYRQFFDSIIAPTLPSESECRLILDEMIRIENSELPLIIRKFSSGRTMDRNTSLRGNLFTEDNRAFVCVDNEASFWFFEECRAGRYNNGILESKIATRTIPIARRTNPGEKQDFRETTFSLKLKFDSQLEGWKLAHVFRAAPQKIDFAGLSLQSRFFRTLYPLNFFLSPKPTKNCFEWQNLNGELRTDEFAESPDFCGYVLYRYAKLYGEVWTNFLDRINGSLDAETIECSNAFIQNSELDIKRTISFMRKQATNNNSVVRDYTQEPWNKMPNAMIEKFINSDLENQSDVTISNNQTRNDWPAIRCGPAQPEIIDFKGEKYVAYCVPYWKIRIQSKELLDANPQAGLLIQISGAGKYFRDGSGYVLMNRDEVKKIIYGEYFTQQCFIDHKEQTNSKNIPESIRNFFKKNGQ